MGRPKKPTRILQLLGSKNAKGREAEPEPPHERPPMPRPLEGRAKTLWNKLIPLLEQMGVLARVDEVYLEAFCRCYDEWRECMLDVKKYGSFMMKTTREGNVVKKANPAAKMAIEWQREWIKIGNLFGLSPSARASLTIERKAAAADGPFESPAGRKTKKKA